ncbi:MAG: hypothetical protein K9W44_15610 [Candidatus Lokiarchaeota archaeon]|nr:hypothetical protein [Candidatus Harpocratesius repetitus]
MLIQSNYVICPICERKVCLKCQKLGLCPEHYEEIPETTKSDLKRLRRFLVISIIIISVIYFAFTFLLIYINNDIRIIIFASSGVQKLVYFLLFLPYIPIFLGILISYDKKVKKLLRYSIEHWKNKR